MRKLKYTESVVVPKCGVGLHVALLIGVIIAEARSGKLHGLKRKLKKLNINMNHLRQMLRQLKKGEITIDSFIDDLKTDRPLKPTLLAFANAIIAHPQTASNKDSIQTFSNIFNVTIKFYRNTLAFPPKLYEPSENADCEITIYDKDIVESADSQAVLLYRKPKNAQRRKIKMRLINLMLNLKIVESKFLSLIDIGIDEGDKSLDQEFDFLIDRISRGIKDLRGTKDEANKLPLAIEAAYVIAMSHVKPITEIMQDCLNAQNDDIAGVEYCFKCFENRKGELSNFSCGHGICNVCYIQYLDAAYKKTRELVWKCPCCTYYILNKAEESSIEADLLSLQNQNSSADVCGICLEPCLKGNAVILHQSSHMLCHKCLKTYIDQKTKGKVYIVVNARGEIKDYECPFKDCTTKFTHKEIEGIYTMEENMRLVQAARKAFSTLSLI